MRKLVVAAVLIVGIALLGGAPASAGGFCVGFEGETFSDERGTSVAMHDNCFSPTVLRIDAGDTVTFHNKDKEAHAVAGAVGVFGDPHKEIGPGKQVAFRFDQEGVIPFYCTFHPGMTGALVIGDGVGPALATGAVQPVDVEAKGVASSGDDDGTPAAAYAVAGLAVTGSVVGLGMLFRRRRALHTPAV